MHRSQRRRWRIGVASTLALAAVAGAGVTPSAADQPDRRGGHGHRAGGAGFSHVGTFDVRDNGTAVAEIVDATKDGRSLIYTDSSGGKVGFVDISDPAHPRAAGTISLGGEPTSVGITDQHALVSVDTSSGNFAAPTGKLYVIDLGNRAVVRTIDLVGQPDAVDISPDGRFATVVIENQRNEDSNGALIPQPPAGTVVVLDIKGKPAAWTSKLVDLTNLPGMYAPSDPEPEYIDINRRNQAVVSLQENNHLAIIDLRTAQVTASFSAGTVDLLNVDATEERLGPQRKGRIILDDSVLARRREPDTVAWIDNTTFVTANEGDYTDENGAEGGSRGFTVFNTSGSVLYEAGASLEYEAIRAGHFNETRAANKGVEPEALTVEKFGGTHLLFIGAERSNVVGVYDVSKGTPEFLQLLPTGIGPEGMKAIPKRDLLVVAAETAAGIFPSMITIYEHDDAAATMTLVSADDANGLPLPWNAMSGLTADRSDPDTLYGVSDSILAEAGIHTIDVSSVPAVITRRVLVTDTAGAVRNDLDLEGIAAAPEGGFWLASEGRVTAGSSRPNLIVKVDTNGVVEFEVALPAALAAGAGNNGLEGLAVTGDGTTQYVYVAVQRPWADDPAETVKIGRYEVATDTWTFVHYALDAVVLPAGAVVGLSELTPLPNGMFAIIERDGLAGTQAVQKKIYGVDLATAGFQPFGAPLTTVPKVLLADVLDELDANTIYTPDKLEGLAVAADGEVYMVTDNDGLDNAIGQTLFLALGPFDALAG